MSDTGAVLDATLAWPDLVVEIGDRDGTGAASAGIRCARECPARDRVASRRRDPLHWSGPGAWHRSRHGAVLVHGEPPPGVPGGGRALLAPGVPLPTRRPADSVMLNLMLRLLRTGRLVLAGPCRLGWGG